MILIMKSAKLINICNFVYWNRMAIQKIKNLNVFFNYKIWENTEIKPVTLNQINTISAAFIQIYYIYFISILLKVS